jgi:hypothetical protein
MPDVTILGNGVSRQLDAIALVAPDDRDGGGGIDDEDEDEDEDDDGGTESLLLDRCGADGVLETSSHRRSGSQAARSL